MAQILSTHGHCTLVSPSLLNEQATSVQVKRLILELARRRAPNDLLLFYFSGHDIALDVEAERQEIYLGTHVFSEEEVAEDETLHLSLSWLRDKLYWQTEAGKVVLILDCCSSGQMGSTGPDPYLQELQRRIDYYFHRSSPVQDTRYKGLRQALTATGHGSATTQEGPTHGHLTARLLPVLSGQVIEALGTQGQLSLIRLYAYLEELYEQQGLPLPSLSGDSASRLCILASFPVSEKRQISPLAASEHASRPASYLPFPRNPHFQPRPGEFAELERLLFAAGSSPVRLGLVGVTGVGGVGKTQLAIEVAYRYQDRFPDGIFWMPATGQDLFAWQQTLAELALKTTYLPPDDDPTHPEAEVRRARHLCRYLGTHPNALLILDNVEVPQLVSTALPELAGAALSCRILYTSRNQTPPAGATSYAVTPLSPEGAFRLLLESTRPALLAEVLAGSQSQEAETARILCQQTDRLPLALTHLQGLLAEDRHLRIQDLLAALQEHGMLSLSRPQNVLPTLEETFSLSWQQVREEPAQECFLLASAFPETIPIPLWLLGLASGLGERARPFDPLWEVCLRLQDLSLLELLSGEQARLHPLVRAFGEQQFQQAGAKGRTLRTQAVERLTATLCDLSLLEQRARQLGYRACLAQVRLARDYAQTLDSSHADPLISLERAMDRESHVLANTRWWLETLPGLFYQQLFNQAVVTGTTLPKQQSPSCWIEQTRLTGTTDHALLRILSGHSSYVTSVAFSPDGRLVLTGSQDSTARLWESSTGRPLATLQGHTGVFSPDGRLVLTGSAGSTARLWESNTGRPLATLQGHTSTINSVAFSPDGRLVLTGSGDSTARLWESSTGQPFATLQGHTGIINSVAFSPNGRLVLTGSGDNTAQLWESKTGKPLATLQGHIGTIHSVAFSPDGRLVLTGSADHTARLWESSTGKPLATLQGHRFYVSSVAFSPDGRLVLTGSGDHTARLWKSKTGKSLATLQGHTDTVTSVAFSPDGRLVLTSDGHGWTFFWDIEKIDKPQHLGLSVTTDEVSTVFWQDATHLLLADYGAGGRQPGVYRLHLQGPCWLPRV